MSGMLNLVNTVSDSKAEYLRDIENDTDRNHRKLDLYITHNNRLCAIGYENNNLVWFSFTNLTDTFLSRRIFESMRQSCFYRRVSLDNILDTVNLTRSDLRSMCHACLDNIETDEPVFSGCISDDVKVITGSAFADVMAVVFEQLRNVIAKIGSEDEILNELERDYQYLEALYNHGIGYDLKRQMKVNQLCSKWKNADCLKLSRRANIRKLYHNVRYFNKNVGVTDVK